MKRKRCNRIDATGRNQKFEQFVKIDYSLIKSEAYRTLKPAYRAIYIEICHFYNGHNNGEISFSVRQAKQNCMVGNATAMNGFKTLEERGFIICHKQSAFNLKADASKGMAREWEITAYPPKEGGQAKRLFKSWRQTKHA
jgi:hypothetical protein